MRVQVSRGDRYGRLTVLREVESPSYIRKFECRCDCGNKSVVWMTGLRSGRSSSCGCLATEIRKSLKCNLRHGFLSDRKTAPLYHVHYDMMKRCYDTSNSNYGNYGGRGITVCKKWHDLSSFVDWNVGLPPRSRFSRGKTIERIDNDKGYCPSNCCWTTRTRQNRNQRTTVRVKYKGRNWVLVDLYEHLFESREIPEGVTARIVYCRLRKGSSLKAALFQPYRSRSYQ
jgi:hypothetical protein